MLAHIPVGLCQEVCCAGQMPTGKFEAGEEDLASGGGVDGRQLPREFEALPRVLLRGLQVVPLVEDASQAKVGSQVPDVGGSPLRCRTRR